MNAFANIANFNGQKPVIDPDDAAMLLIDHQSGLFQVVKDIDLPQLRANVTALAKAASLLKMPVITTASVPQGPNGPLIPEIHQAAPHARYVARKGEINAFDNPEFAAAVEATGKKTLVIAGTITSVCLAFPSLSAVAAGYKVFAVVDASGTVSKMASDLTIARLVQAGVVPIDTMGTLSEMQKSWNRPDAQEWAEVYAQAMPHYQLLIESYIKAQQVASEHETLDSQRS
ncbi:isochorismatase family protein [Cupriavidus sp. CuC1]|uniref:isochorismatase family protein n=1 Tax=Cupriavidus sp. CuC1 TaxID=3373131 RepID=UPI0037D89D06